MTQLRYAIALFLLLLSGCTSAPQAQVATTAPLTATLPATPTLAVRQATATALPATPVGPPPPPTLVPLPPPEAPGAALPAFTGDALLYTRPDRFLMLNDSTGRTLWLTSDEQFCGRSNTAMTQSGAWSADGRYVAIACQDDSASSKVSVELAMVHVLDMASGTQRRVAVGHDDARGVRVDAYAGPWSPVAPQLLVFTYQITVTETASRSMSDLRVYDVATDTTTQLVAFDPEAYITQGAQWSPDGTQVAFMNKQPDDQAPSIYVIDADGSNLRRVPLEASVEYASLDTHVLEWSPDGTALFVNRAPSSASDTFMWQLVRVDSASGVQHVVAEGARGPVDVRWSPDGQWFVAGPQTTQDGTLAGWSLHRADDTLAQTFSSDSQRSIEDAAWMPDSQQLVLAINRVNFGAEVALADTDGAEQVIARLPWLRARQIAVAPAGTLLAVAFEDRGFVLDLQGNLLSEFSGQIHGWRPAQ